MNFLHKSGHHKNHNHHEKNQNHHEKKQHHHHHHHEKEEQDISFLTDPNIVIPESKILRMKELDTFESKKKEKNFF